MKHLLRALCLTLAFCMPALAECQGRDLMAEPPKLAIEAPFAQGNFWTARKGDQRLLLVGTYHKDDPRFDAVIQDLGPPLSAAAGLMLEVGPEEMAALKAHMADHPEILFDQSGPSLRAQLGDADWQRLAQALALRGMPAAAALKMRPWFIATMLQTPPCALNTPGRGLDARLSDLAQAQGLPIQALEPFDTAFQTFASLTAQDQLEMIRQSLLTEALAEDFAVTLAAAYFRGESLAFVRFSRDYVIQTLGLPPSEVDRQMDLAFDLLLTPRNRAWIPVIEARAAEGPQLVAFGALHLPGETGVLNLLAARGWTIAPWTSGEAWPQ